MDISSVYILFKPLHPTCPTPLSLLVFHDVPVTSLIYFLLETLNTHMQGTGESLVSKMRIALSKVAQETRTPSAGSPLIATKRNMKIMNR